MRIRNVTHELEVKLNPVPSAPSSVRNARGRGEWKVYGDGTRKCKVSVPRVDLPDDAVLYLIVNGLRIGEMKIQHGIARFKRESERGDGVPNVEADQPLQIQLAGEVILEGKFYLE